MKQPRHFTAGLVGPIFAICLGGCVGASSPASAPYRLSASAAVAAGDVRVTGATDMPDGAIVTIYAWSDTEEPHREWTGHAIVRAGSFSGVAATAAWRARTVHLSIAIDGDRGQSPEVLAVIGQDGARLSGAGVQVAEDGSRFIETRLDASRDTPSST